MNDAEFNRINDSLTLARHKYPNCRVASCECNLKQWTPGCFCTCHWFSMPGGISGNWTLTDAANSAKEGRPIINEL